MESYSLRYDLNELVKNYDKYRRENNTFKIISQGSFIERLKDKDLAKGLTNVSDTELNINKMNINKFISKWIEGSDYSQLWQLNNQTIIMGIEDGKHTTNSALDVMLFNNFQQHEINIKRREIQEVVKMDLEFDRNVEVDIFVNTKCYQFPLISMVYNGVKVHYRGVSSRNIISYLYQVVEYLLPSYLISVVELGSESRSYIMKKKLLEWFCELEITSTSNMTEQIVKDAYDNLNFIVNTYNNDKLDEKYNYLLNIKEGFVDNLQKAFRNRFYNTFVPDRELGEYNSLFELIDKCLSRLVTYMQSKSSRDPPFDIKKYYFYDQPDREKNKLKISRDRMMYDVISFFPHSHIKDTWSSLHPDIQLGLYHLGIHMNLTGTNKLYGMNTPLSRFISWMTSVHFSHKPVLVKSLIKKVCEGIYLQMKEKGVIRYHQLEALFGYRNTHLILEEVRDDYLNWVTGDQQKYGEKQGRHINKWFHEFVKFDAGYGMLGTIFKNNYYNYGGKDEILKNPYNYLSAKGVVDDFKVETNDGKRSITKTNYFDLIQSPEDFFKRDKKDRRNKVLIKKTEFIKQRIVINTTLNTYESLAPLNKMVQTITTGSGVTYFSNTKEQKAELYARIEKYLLYNKYIRKRYLILPLDYSSYDHTITLDFVLRSMINLFEYVNCDMNAHINNFISWLAKEKIHFPELKNDPINDQNYKFGMLSGWKITSSVESLGNAITSFGIVKELGLELTDLITMGDDLFIVLDLPDLEDEQIKDVLDAICKKYETLGYQMNPSKNSAGYYFGEFLRVTYIPGVSIGYPLRILPSITVNKSESMKETFGIVEFQSTLKKILRRYAISSQLHQWTQYFASVYEKNDIRQYAYDYLLHPYNYKLYRKKVIRYQYKLVAKHTPIFKRLTKLFPGAEKVVENYIYDNIITDSVYITYLQKLPKPQRPNLHNYQVKRLHYLLRGFKTAYRRKVEGQKTLRLSSYHVHQIIKILLNKRMISVMEGRNLVYHICNILLKQGELSYKSYCHNLAIVDKCVTKGQLLSVLDDERISIYDLDTPTVIVSRVKDVLIKYINIRMGVLEKADQELLRSVLHKNRHYLIKLAVTKIIDHSLDYYVEGFLLPLSLNTD